jgi:hypothetical protein
MEGLGPDALDLLDEGARLVRIRRKGALPHESEEVLFAQPSM